jgi:hypothetical protein
MRAFQLIIVAGLTIPHPLSGQCKVPLHGMVVDELGKPLPGAQVSFIEDKVYDYQQLPKASFTTDAAGKFSAGVSISQPGKYWVMAMKDADGYPDNRVLFYVDREPPKISLSCAEHGSEFVVQLGPKVAFIRRLTILDAQTGRPLEKAELTVRRVSRALTWTDLEKLFVKTAVSGETPDLKLALPSGVDISYEISAPVYQTSPGTILHLTPLEDANLEVMLQRSTPAPVQLP